jgi:light-regulated signal transduction histidine kinase (bacteriophytochrome)
LHKITAFGDRLQTHLEDSLDDKGRQYLDILVNASGRLERLIDDLLEYSRVGQPEENPLVEVPLQEFVGTILEDLSELVAKKKADILLSDKMPTLWTHPGRLRRVMTNLIINALKFHKPDETPKVFIGAEESEDQVVIVVRDEGIGFDPKFTDHIFHVFTRLHTCFEYPGTGIGLALCRRIVDRYGGSIVAHGESGEGATFTVTLPKVYPLHNIGGPL